MNLKIIENAMNPLINPKTHVEILECDWKQHRLDLIGQLEKYMYGKPKTLDWKMNSTLIEKGISHEGIGNRKQLKLIVSRNNKKIQINLLMYLPVNKKKPPIFVGINFLGNHTIDGDPNIIINKNYTIKKQAYIMTNKGRGMSSNSWPIKYILESGYGIATYHCSDIDPDYDDKFNNGIHDFLEQKSNLGTIAGWAWGLQRIMDYLETDKDVDSNNVILFGHSRMGKTALWTGAIDERFKIIISNCSGCSGASYSRNVKKDKTETVKLINKNFPHWFNEKYKYFSDNLDQMPFDQHYLLSCIAPRPLYISSAIDDINADPEGEYISCILASKTYNLLKKPTNIPYNMPECNKPILNGYIGYHIHDGKHELRLYDWMQYIKFANHQLTDIKN